MQPTQLGETEEVITGCTFPDSPLRKNKTERSTAANEILEEGSRGKGGWRVGGLRAFNTEGEKKMLSAEETAVRRVSRILIAALMGTSELAGILEMMEEQKNPPKNEEMLMFDHETGRLDNVWKACNSVRDKN